jgi:hypothetical protein
MFLKGSIKLWNMKECMHIPHISWQKMKVETTESVFLATAICLTGYVEGQASRVNLLSYIQATMNRSNISCSYFSWR